MIHIFHVHIMVLQILTTTSDKSEFRTSVGLLCVSSGWFPWTPSSYGEHHATFLYEILVSTVQGFVPYVPVCVCVYLCGHVSVSAFDFIDFTLVT